MRADTTDNQMLNVLRLATQVGAMSTSDQFTEMAEIALNTGLPGEAISAIEAGKSKNVFKGSRVADIDKMLERAKLAAEIDKKSLAQQETAAKANAQGNLDVKLGAAYLSYGDFHEGHRGADAWHRQGWRAQRRRSRDPAGHRLP